MLYFSHRKEGVEIDPSIVYNQLELLAFHKIAFAHTLVADNYSFHVDTKEFGIYGRAPKYGGVLEVGFVEENPVICSGPMGEFTFEENGIFIIAPQSEFDVTVKNPGQLHRHTSVEFLIRARMQSVSDCLPPSGKTITLPLYIPPAPENSEIISLIRNIACAKTARLERSYFEECADFMLLMHKLSERVCTAQKGTDTVSPGNRRHCVRAKAYISENISQRLSVGDVASAIGVSKNYLTNVFSSTEGIPLMEYINRSKLSYMMILIRRYGYTLAQAGKHVGFTDVNYISRIFKRYYGMTVTEYKRSLEREES